MRHNIEEKPIPRGEDAIFINEPWLVDDSLLEYPIDIPQPDSESDNIRAFIPVDLNRQAIIRRLDYVIAKYGEATEENEISFSIEVGQIMSQVEVYDQIWSARESCEAGEHSLKTIELVKEIMERLENIPDGCAEMFPFEEIEVLRTEYLR